MTDRQSRHRRTVAWAVVLAVVVLAAETVLGVMINPPAWIYLAGLAVLVFIGFVTAHRLLSDKG